MTMYTPRSWFDRLIKKSAYDFSTIEGLQSFVQKGLKLPGYGVNYRLHQNNQVLDEDAARNILVSSILESPQFSAYFEQIKRVVGRLERPEWSPLTVEYHDNELILDHADIFQMPIKLGPTITLRRRGANPTTTRQQRSVDQRNEALQAKLQNIQTTDEMSYLTHANQCGFLAGRTRFGFIHTKNQWAVSVKTLIPGMTMEQLQGFVDATGQQSLASLSTHAGPIPGDVEQTSGGVLGYHKAFANAIVDFLNLEFEIDIDEIARQYADTIGDTGLRPLEHWLQGDPKDLILKKLTERRRNIDPNDIAEYFAAGYEGTLV